MYENDVENISSAELSETEDRTRNGEYCGPSPLVIGSRAPSNKFAELCDKTHHLTAETTPVTYQNDYRHRA